MLLHIYKRKQCLKHTKANVKKTRILFINFCVPIILFWPHSLGNQVHQLARSASANKYTYTQIDIYVYMYIYYFH